MPRRVFSFPLPTGVGWSRVGWGGVGLVGGVLTCVQGRGKYALHLGWNLKRGLLGYFLFTHIEWKKREREFTLVDSCGVSGPVCSRSCHHSPLRQAGIIPTLPVSGAHQSAKFTHCPKTQADEQQSSMSMQPLSYPLTQLCSLRGNRKAGFITTVVE